ncbi:hypothetical protein SOVF_200400 isoform B [Spinacia oleracea]|nr:hypothetical protein SOVF_200400 isoform B [Spinacia oleracea]
MKSRNSTPIRGPGQRSITSTFKLRSSQPCFANHTEGSGVLLNKNRSGSNFSLTNFLNRKFHTTSVLPFDKDEKTFSEVKKESFPLAENYDSINETISRDEKYDCAGSRDEKGGVIEDSVFKLFNDSGGKVRKRSSECITAVPSKLKGVSKQHSQNHLVVLGDDPKPKRRARGGVSCSYTKQRPVYNYYENGTGFWEPERVGVDNDEVGSTEMWEGMGSTTTLGGLDDLSSFDHL